MKKATKLKDKELNCALGWLAREGKVSFDESGEEIVISLFLFFYYFMYGLYKPWVLLLKRPDNHDDNRGFFIYFNMENELIYPEILEKTESAEEIFPVVDEKKHVLGFATRKFCHAGSKPLHPVVHLHVYNKNGDLYLQKRSMNKDI